MKKNIHPQYFPEAEIRCACGNIIKVGSTKKLIEVEICSNCHPFYTGKEKLVDTTGRVEKFKRRASQKKEIVRKKKEKRIAKKAKKASKI